LGDEKVAEDFPHGNQRKHLDRNYIRQCPSMISTVHEEVSNKNHSEVYKSQIASISCHLSHARVFVPRNMKMVIQVILIIFDKYIPLIHLVLINETYIHRL